MNGGRDSGPPSGMPRYSSPENKRLMKINMKKIFIFWVLWVCFWGVVTQGLYYYKSREISKILEMAEVVDAKVIAMHWVGTQGSRSSTKQPLSVSGTYLRNVSFSYKYNGNSYVYKARTSKRELPDYFYNLVENDIVKIYIIPNIPENTYFKPDLEKYNILKYGWVIMGIFPLLLLGPIVVVGLFLKILLPVHHSVMRNKS